jgi:hypothetical protein
MWQRAGQRVGVHMSVLEPEIRPVRAEAVVPGQRGPVEEPGEAASPTVLDHVQSHSRRCYWDVAECRWQCSP